MMPRSICRLHHLSRSDASAIVTGTSLPSSGYWMAYREKSDDWEHDDFVLIETSTFVELDCR
jgi:hypothetical protein